MFKRVRESNIILLGEILGASGRDSESPTLIFEPFQWVEWMTTQQHNLKAKAHTKAHPQENYLSSHHMSGFDLLNENPIEKPVERVLVIGNSVSQFMKSARLSGHCQH